MGGPRWHATFILMAVSWSHMLVKPCQGQAIGKTCSDAAKDVFELELLEVGVWADAAVGN